MRRRLVAAVLVSLVAAQSPRASATPSREILTASVYIEAAYEAVSERFTQAEGYEAWYSSPCREFGARPGDPVVWGHEERIFYRGTRKRIEKGEGLTQAFHFVGFGFEEPPTPVEIDILERGETVLVSIRHDCTEAPKTCDIISSVGWLKSLSRLKTLLETGRVMPWPEDPRPPSLVTTGDLCVETSRHCLTSNLPSLTKKSERHRFSSFVS